MRAQHLLADLHLDGGEEIGIFGKLDDDGARQLGEIAGGGDLALVRQAVGIGETGARHAETLRRLVHALNEGLLAAGHGLGDHHRDIVGRLDDEHLERDVERDRLALFQPELARGLLRRSLGADGFGIGLDLAGLHRLEGHIGCHQLGEGCRKPLRVGVLGVEHCAVIGLEYQGWAG